MEKIKTTLNEDEIDKLMKLKKLLRRHRCSFLVYDNKDLPSYHTKSGTAHYEGKS